MKRVRTILALVLAGLWVPITSHCQLETIPWLQFFACGNQAEQTPYQDHECDGDGCAVIESGLYQCEDDAPVVTPPATTPAAILAVLVLDISTFAAPVRQTEASAAPPELPVTWQFAYRTALPVRAPSLAS